MSNIERLLTKAWTDFFNNSSVPTHIFVGQAVFDEFQQGLKNKITGTIILPSRTKMEAVKSLGPYDVVFGRKITLE